MEFREVKLPSELGSAVVPAIGRRTNPEFYRRVVEHAPTQTWAEFGVCTGRSANWFLKLMAKTGRLHLFDSYFGLPEDWDLEVPQPGRKRMGITRKGTFSKGGKPPEMNDDRVQHHVGLFADTLPVEFEEQLGFIHLDADLYSSTRDVLQGIRDSIGPGTVMIFDQLIQWGDNCNTNWRQHEYKALKESGLNMEWIANDGACAVAGIVR